jgi:hypothetical protein
MVEKFFCKKIIRTEFGKNILSLIFIVKDESLFEYGNKSLASELISVDPYKDEEVKWMTNVILSTNKYEEENYLEITHIDDNYIETYSHIDIDGLKEVPKEVIEEFKSKLESNQVIGVGFIRSKTKKENVEYRKYKFSLNEFGEYDFFDFYD